MEKYLEFLKNVDMNQVNSFETQVFSSENDVGIEDDKFLVYFSLKSEEDAERFYDFALNFYTDGLVKDLTYDKSRNTKQVMVII